MPKRIEPSVDDLLADLVNEGWDAPSDQTLASPAESQPDMGNPITVADQEVTPEPQPDTEIPVSQTNQEVTPEPEYPPVPTKGEYQEPQPPADPTDGQTSVGLDGRPQRAMDVGVLANLAAGRMTADQAASFAGVSVDEVQASLAVALRQVPPEEIAKAMGLQAAEQQLKSGAIYGAILADLMADMAQGKLKPETKIELAKLLAKVGRIEPKEDKGVGAGGGFVLNINLGAAGPQPVTIESD